ncbi:MAG: helix-turn-helix domain-containing protein [Candidatus Rokuibacteriota bacterium]
MSATAALPAAPARPLPGFHGAVSDFKRRLIEATLTQSGGNRTRAARALGLQRTYLLRLMREFEIRVPPAPLPPRRGEASAGAGHAPEAAPQTR